MRYNENSNCKECNTVRLETIDIPLILPQPVSGRASNYEEDEERGFFAKLFKKKDVPEKSFYESRIEEYGYDEL